MGWLFMRSLGGHATPKAYLDDQFTYERPSGRSRVLASRLVGLRTYYAAVEHVAATTGCREVWGLVCLVRYNPRDREGYVFGYKDMSESMGPVQDACPAAVLDLLTPTDKTFALDWRARCRARLAARRTNRAKPAPRPGQLVVFAAAICFRNGRSFTQLRAVRLPGRRGLIFQAEDGGFYRIPGFKALDYAIAPAPPPVAA
jgi:hypothetical protein